MDTSFLLNAKSKMSVPTKCGHCNKVTTKRCTGCYVSYYCSKECQRAEWKLHKITCKQIRHTLKRATRLFNAKSGRNVFEKHFQDNPLVLNTTYRNRDEFFTWKNDPVEKLRRSNHLETLYCWVRDTYKTRGYTVQKHPLQSLGDYDKVMRNARKDLKNIYILQYDFCKPWCIFVANRQAAFGDITWQQNPAGMAGGFHLIVGDNYVDGALSYSDEKLIEWFKTFKVGIANVISTVGKFKSCNICFDDVADEMRTPCNVCKQEVCMECVTKIYDRRLLYTCPFCRNNVI